ncbi:MAG: hypothetical protein IT233_02315 [Bacteroidia bacterium]|nr:hypothetical protein [Bacteroidia bacterium]
MIRHLLHSEIDKVRWDRCVQKNTDLIYPLSWWLDIVSPGWEALADEEYTTVMPLTWRKKAGFRYLCQPPFTQQLGIFGPAPEETFLNAIPKEFRLTEINLNEKNTGAGERSVNLLLDLSRTYTELFSSYSENTRRNIKKTREGLYVFSDQVTPEELLALYRRNQGARHVQLKAGQAGLLNELIRITRIKNCGRTVGLRNPEGRLLTAAFFVWTESRVIFLFSATDLTEKLRWLSLLIDLCIEYDAGKPRVLDFEGSNHADLARFYKGFGAKEVVYLRLRKNRLPFWIKWMK